MPDGGIIPRAEYEVPTGGFSAGGKMYVFFTTDHYQQNGGNFMGRSVLARLNDLGRNIGMFTYLYDVSCRPGITCRFPDGKDKPQIGAFINISPVIVDNAEIPGFSQNPGQGLLLWGSGEYRMSNPYLAYIPLDSVEDSRTLYYWHIDPNTNQGGWKTDESLASPLFEQPGIGELSVTWNPFLRKWLMLYNHFNPQGINYRVADKPMGPWSEARILFDEACDRGFGHFMSGGAYGPYVISRFTKGDATTTTIYWTMSTWNPYQVMLMKSILRLSDANRVDKD